MRSGIIKPKLRSGLVVLARKRNAGPMKDRREKRQNRNSWRKEYREIEMDWWGLN